MKNLKKIIAVSLIALMLGSMIPCFAAKEEGPFVYVTIYDGKKVVLAETKVEKSDEDNDGSWTINDALLSVHKSKCKDGYKTENGSYGLFITKLWNIENGGSYGYYKNNRMCMGLTETLSETEPDHLYAFVYSDAAGYSDAYSYFDQYSLTGKAKDTLKLTLKYVTFDESYNQTDVPVADALITFDGKKTEFKTDENGRVEIELPAYSAVISAEKEGLTLIPPVCKYHLDEMKSGNYTYLIIVIVITAVIAAAVVCVILFNNKNRKKAN